MGKGRKGEWREKLLSIYVALNFLYTFYKFGTES